MLLTIFTPTYNRGYILRALFESLCSQTYFDFEWLIVDDGSTDDTEELISELQSLPSNFEVRYYKQLNGGKHRAINSGLRLAKGELFYIVDSDDRLTPDAVSWIKQAYASIKNDDRFAGLSGIRIYPNGRKIGGGEDFGSIDASAMEIREKYGIEGDQAEVFKTEILRKYPFPEFEGEKFCPEALVWFRIAQNYMLRYYHKAIYICDYLPDGLTAKIANLRHQSPLASLTYYSELFGYEDTCHLKMRAAINYWRFMKCRLLSETHKMHMLNIYSAIACPLGLAAKINDFVHHRC